MDPYALPSPIQEALSDLRTALDAHPDVLAGTHLGVSFEDIKAIEDENTAIADILACTPAGPRAPKHAPAHPGEAQTQPGQSPEAQSAQKRHTPVAVTASVAPPNETVNRPPDDLSSWLLDFPTF